MNGLRFLLCLLLGGLTVACSQAGLDGTAADLNPPETYTPLNRFSKDATAADLLQISKHVNEALDDLNEIDLSIDDGHIRNARADAKVLLADLAGAEKHSRIRPEPSSPQTIAAIKSALPAIKFPDFVPSNRYPLPDRLNFPGHPLELALPDRAKTIGLIFTPPNAQGLFIGIDGKLLNVYLLTAADLLNETSRESSELYPDSPNESSIDDLGDYRMKVITDLTQMGSDILAGIVYLHDHVSPPGDLPEPIMVYSIVNGVVYAQYKPFIKDDLSAGAEITNSSAGAAQLRQLRTNPTTARMTVTVIETPPAHASTKPPGGRSILLLGEVANPGWAVIPSDKSMTMSSAIAMANGPTRLAGAYVTVTRNMPDGTTVIFNEVNLLKVLNKTGADFALQDGDVVNLSKTSILFGED